MPATLVEHRQLIEELIELMLRDLRAMWSGLRFDRPDLVRAALRSELPPLLRTYGDIGAVLASDTYDELRDQHAPAGAPAFRSTLAPPVPAEQVDAHIGWATTPIWSADPDPDAALTLLKGGTERLVQAPERDTIEINITTDSLDVGVARVPQPGACWWCTMLASRGAIYLTEASAEFTKDHKRYHDNCKCRPWPVFHPDQLPDINRELYDEWDRVTGPTKTSEEARQVWKRHIGQRNAASAIR